MRTARLALLAALALAAPLGSARADVVVDGTLVPGDGPVPILEDAAGELRIEERFGQRSGSNLFHSFSEFDVGEASTAVFTGSAPISNVIGRITGGPSRIDGALRVDIPGANLFLMNPAGIVFGERASVNVSGAFAATTADWLQLGARLEDRFTADPSSSSVLLAAPVSAFGFLSEAHLDDPVAGIDVGSGSQLFAPGGDVALVGGGVTLGAGSWTGARDRVSLVSVARPEWDARVLFAAGERPELVGFGELGRLNVHGIAQGRAISSRSADAWISGAAAGLPAGLRASGGIDVISRGTVGIERGFLIAQSASERVAPISIDARRLLVQRGGLVDVGWLPASPGADLRPGSPEKLPPSLRIHAESVSVTDGGAVTLRLQGIREGSPEHGGLRIDADRRVDVLRGGQIDARFGARSGGLLEIDASGGVLRLDAGARIGARIDAPTDGPGFDPGVDLGGSLRLRADRVAVLGGSRIETGGGRLGDPTAVAAGRLDLRAREVLLSGVDARGLPSALSSGSNWGLGSAGDVVVRAHRLRLRDGAEISAESQVGGSAGSLRLRVDELWIDAGGALRTRTAGGDGGEIDVGGDLLALRGGEIRTDGGADGGDVAIRSELMLLDGGQVSANAGRAGGRIDVDSDFLVRGAPSQIVADSQSGLPGVIDVAAAEVSLTQGLVELPSEFLRTDLSLRPSCFARDPGESSLVVARAPGAASSPDGWLRAFETDAAAPAAVAARPVGPESGRRAGARAASLPALRRALMDAEEAGDRVQLARVLGRLGELYGAAGEPDWAEDQLRRGIDFARSAGALPLTAALLNDLGNQLATRSRFRDALAAYGEARDLAWASQRGGTAVSALANAARAAGRLGEVAEADALLAQARQWLPQQPASRRAVFAWIHSAGTELALGEATGGAGAARMLRAHADLVRAVELASELADARAASFALARLGALYERDGRSREALRATRRAILAAQRANAPDAEYRWHAQAARLLRGLGRRAAAIDAYRRSVALVEPLRLELAGRSVREEWSFGTRLAPLYLELADVLLREAAAVEPGRAERLLRDARGTLEQLRSAELRNYLRDECLPALDAGERPIEGIPGAAVVYPVLLPDRVELLVSVGDESLRRYEVAVPAERVAAQVRSLSAALQDTGSRAYLGPARQLYRWLIEPLVSSLDRARVDTLVFVPQGVLRAIPLAALHDGERFLVERFALAVSPGLTFTDPRPLEQSHPRVLLAGLTQAVRDFPALPHVASELSAIASLYPGTVLVDDQFTGPRLERALRTQAPSIVHVASHVLLGGDVSESFVLSHEGPISIDEFAGWIAPRAQRERPLELMVLSGCETAVGDDRAALGLAGVVVRSGVRSALGSLWKIQDDATAALMAQFYSSLREPGQSRAQALRSAQRALLSDPQRAHPGYWAAFVLLNVWL